MQNNAKFAILYDVTNLLDKGRGNMNKNTEFKPYIPAEKVTPELTVTSVIMGCILAVIFGAANAYLGLRVGMTVSASIPAAVISMGVIRVILRRNSILESNMVQTIGSAGESLAAGAIFTMPALFLWAEEGLSDKPGIVEITLIALCGGILGVLFINSRKFRPAAHGTGHSSAAGITHISPCCGHSSKWILLLLVPASAAFHSLKKHAVLHIIWFLTDRLADLIQSRHIIPKPHICHGGQIIPFAVFLSKRIQHIHSFLIMATLYIIGSRTSPHALLILVST